MFKRKCEPETKYPVITTEMRYLPGTKEVIEFRLYQCERYWTAYASDNQIGGQDRPTREEAIDAFLHHVLLYRKEDELCRKRCLAAIALERKKKIERYAARFLNNLLLNPAILTSMTPDQVTERAIMIAESFVGQLDKFEGNP